MSGGKSIVINCFKVPLGKHNVTLSDGTKAELTISGTLELPKCSLSYSVKDQGGFDRYQLVDENCDGSIDLFAEKQSDKKNWTKNRTGDGSPLQNYYVFNPMIAEALGKLAPGFTFSSRACRTYLVSSRTAIPIGGYGSIHGLGTTDSVSKLNFGLSSDKPVKAINAETYFETGKAELSATAKQKLEQFARDYEGGEIVIEGHCDPRGSSEYNFELGKARANAAAIYLEKELRKLVKSTAVISTISFGENMAAGKTYERARRAVITAGEIPLKRALDNVKGNPYLIDASGSMISAWSTVKGYQFPRGTEIYSFNECVGMVKGLELKPDCHTPLWKSLYRLITETKEGVRIVVITDGIDTEGFPAGVNIDGLIALAKQKHTKVSTVFIGTPHTETEQVMLRISVATGGSFYLKTR